MQVPAVEQRQIFESYISFVHTTIAVTCEIAYVAFDVSDRRAVVCMHILIGFCTMYYARTMLSDRRDAIVELKRQLLRVNLSSFLNALAQISICVALRGRCLRKRPLWLDLMRFNHIIFFVRPARYVANRVEHQMARWGVVM